MLIHFFQFYKDTLQDEPSPDKKEVKKERSPSPEEEDAGEKEADKTEETAVKEEIKTETDIKMETESGEECIPALRTESCPGMPPILLGAILQGEKWKRLCSQREHYLSI